MGRLPSIAYWGAELGPHTDDELVAIADAGRSARLVEPRRRTGHRVDPPRARDRLDGPAGRRRQPSRRGLVAVVHRHLALRRWGFGARHRWRSGCHPRHPRGSRDGRGGRRGREAPSRHRDRARPLGSRPREGDRRQHRRRGVPARRGQPRAPGPARGIRGARLRRSLGQGAHPAAASARHRHPPSRGAQGTNRCGCRDARVRRPTGLLVPRRRGVVGARRVLGQSPALRRTALPRHAGHRRRRAPAARRGAAREGRAIHEPLGLRRLRARARRGRGAIPRVPARARRSADEASARDAERLGGGVLRPRPSATDGAGRHRRGPRRRAFRARRWLVPRPARRYRGSRRLVRRRGGVARRPPPAHRPCAGARHGVRPLGRARDGQPRLRDRPRTPRVDHGHRCAPPAGVAASAGAEPRDSRGIRLPCAIGCSRFSPSTTSGTSSGTTTAISSTRARSRAVSPASMCRRSPPTGSWTS